MRMKVDKRHIEDEKNMWYEDHDPGKDTSSMGSLFRLFYVNKNWSLIEPWLQQIHEL